jgi:hypothetical protein
MRKYILISMILSVLPIMWACNSRPAQSSYPMSLEKNAVSHLSSILNSSEGHAMSGMELAHKEGHEELFKIDLPVNETDERPQFGKAYRNDETGSTIVFYDTVIEGDTISPIGTADLTTVIHDWETEPDTTINYCVHARGNGIYTFYNIRHKGCHCSHHDEHPDGFPEYAPCLVYIKPGGKELLITWGYERSKREYKLENKTAASQPDTPSQYEVQIKEEKSASGEGEMDAVKSVWLTNKSTGKTFRVCVTNPMAEAQWGKMNGDEADAVDVPLSQIAAADKAMIAPCDDVKVIVEGCPDGRNIWTYIIDPYTGTAKQLPSSEGVIGVDLDKKEIIASSYGYDSDGRYSVKKAYSAEGKFLRIVGNKERE